MNINDITKINHRSYYTNNTSTNIPKSNYFKNLITRILISIILVISALIYVKIDDNNLLNIEEYVYKDNIKFTKINNWYHDNIGKIIPEVKEDSKLVFSNSDIKNRNYEEYLDGVKIDDFKDSPVAILNGGIVVFIGEKEGYGNTLIIQGNDGIDYWYGNITNISVNLYDYLEKDTLIGSTNDDYIYLVLEKDGKYISYEEYLQ